AEVQGREARSAGVRGGVARPARGPRGRARRGLDPRLRRDRRHRDGGGSRFPRRGPVLVDRRLGGTAVLGGDGRGVRVLVRPDAGTGGVRYRHRAPGRPGARRRVALPGARAVHLLPAAAPDPGRGRAGDARSRHRYRADPYALSSAPPAPSPAAGASRLSHAPVAAPPAQAVAPSARLPPHSPQRPHLSRLPPHHPTWSWLLRAWSLSLCSERRNAAVCTTIPGAARVGRAAA